MKFVLDIGGTDIKYGLINENHQLVHQDSISTSTIDSKESFYSTIINLEKQYENIDGIAISMPGIIDSSIGLVHLVAVFPYLSNTNVKEELEALSGLPVSIENDAKSAALCEARIGNAKDYSDAICIVFGTGIGGSIIKDHNIHHGSHLLSGEVSTIIVSPDGTEWSDICSTKNLCRLVAEAKGIETINGKEVYQLYRENDEIVKGILNTYYKNIAIQLYNFQYIFDPGIILLGGGISKEPLFIEGVQQAIDDMKEGKFIQPKIDTCKYYNDANLYGAYYHFLDQH